MDVRSSTAEIVYGPYHPFWGAPFILKIKLDGEYIVNAEIETGFCYKALEKRLVGSELDACLPIVGRVDAENTIFCERLFCETVEKILEITTTERTKDIRSIFCELSRVSSHLRCLSRISNAVGMETATHFFLREREMILELFELIVGARFSLNFLRVGGVQWDISDGFLEKVGEFILIMRHRLREYNEIITYNYAFLGRVSGVGVVGSDLAMNYGVTGVNLRASGVCVDMRDRDFEKVSSFGISVGSGEVGILGDCFDRFLIRLREIGTSLDVLSFLIKGTKKGPYSVPTINKKNKHNRSGYHAVESPRGLMGLFLEISEDQKVLAAQFRTPSMFSLSLFAKILEGQRAQDVEVIFSSLDIYLPEVDK